MKGDDSSYPTRFLTSDVRFIPFLCDLAVYAFPEFLLISPSVALSLLPFRGSFALGKFSDGPKFLRLLRA